MILTSDSRHPCYLSEPILRFVEHRALNKSPAGVPPLFRKHHSYIVRNPDLDSVKRKGIDRRLRQPSEYIASLLETNEYLDPLMGAI